MAKLVMVSSGRQQFPEGILVVSRSHKRGHIFVNISTRVRVLLASHIFHDCVHFGLDISRKSFYGTLPWEIGEALQQREEGFGNTWVLMH